MRTTEDNQKLLKLGQILASPEACAGQLLHHDLHNNNVSMICRKAFPNTGLLIDVTVQGVHARAC